MNHHAPILRSVLFTSVLGLTILTGCSDDRAQQNPISPDGFANQGSMIVIGHDAATLTFDARLQEIRALAAGREVSATVEALDGLFVELGAAAESGAVSESQVVQYASNAQTLVAKIDIDVHFGTDEKCDAAFKCVESTQTCVSVTWHVEGTGGGRNCYNFTMGK